MRNSAILSALLHASILLLLFVGLPDFLRRNLEPPPIIPIEIINIADITQATSRTVKPKENGPKEEPKEKPKPPQPTPVAEKIPEPEPEPEKKPEPAPEPEPQLTMDELLAPVEKEKPKEEEKKKEKPKEKPKEKKEKKKDKPKKKPKPKKNFMSLLNNIEKTESSSEGPTQPEQDESSTADHAANNIGDTLSITELDLIRRQLQQCWNVPAGAKDGKNLNVDIKLEINPDATVRSAVIIKTSKPMSDPHMRALADSAKRAVQNPKCSPLKLPLDRYDQWRTVTIGFNPKDML